MIKSAIAALLFAVSAAAGPLQPEDAPEPLRPWVKWALHGREAEACPFLNGQTENRRCAWPGALRLELTEAGGSFAQAWRSYAEGWAPLPGDAAHWPQDVTVDGVPAAVLARDGGPAVRLKPGARSVAGRFRWEALPEGLPVPRETGLVALAVSGKAVPFPSRDEAGRLWVQKARAAGEERAHLEVAVHRRLVDSVPLLLVTHVQLRVSGRAREELLGKALPPGFVPMSLVSPLPARLDPDGRLRIQARAGTWDLELGARREGRSDEVTLGEPGGTWDPDEPWAFEADEALRGVSVEGPPALDPSQTEMPQAWRRFPTYLMKPGSKLRLVERRRGDADPQADRLSLDRTLWLDFKGKGYTVRDRLSGTLSRSWRLTMGPETALGRVSVNGSDQFITALTSGGPAGLELRQSQLNAEADSRIDGRRFSIPAVGWAHDFEHVGGRLNLPPGWRLVYAWGADRAEPSWVSAWTLLDIFLVMILAFAVARLWDERWGAPALAGAALCWHEPGALRWVWLWALAAEALGRALPEGKVRQAVRLGRGLALGCAMLWLVPFLVTQVRGGLFPQLEKISRDGGWLAPGFAGAMNQSMGMISGAASTVGSAEDEGLADQKEMGEVDASLAMNAAQQEPAAPAPKPTGVEMRPREMASFKKLFREDKRERAYASKYGYAAAQNLLALDPRSAVSTGPGVPNWSWRAVNLVWNGPVRSDQRLRFLLLGPRLNLLLALARVALSVCLLLLFLGLPVEDWLTSARSRSGWTRGLRWLFPAALLLALAAPRASAEMPNPEILNQLTQRLLERPDCAPQCADSPRLRLEAAGNSLRLRLEVHAGAATAVPLPGGGQAWTPTAVLLDGAAAPGVRREGDGTLWLPVGPGSHQVILEGALPEVEIVPLNLPLKPRRVEASVTGWTLHGLREDGRADDSLQLARLRAAAGTPAARAAGTLPPFVQVARILRLGLSWEMETTVSRMTPTGAPIVVEVPLLAGESVTSDVAVKKGKAQVSLGPQASEARWTSVLAESGSVVLTAPDAVPWVEAWRLEAGPVWHTAASGIAPVRAAGGERALSWRPWPGESVTLAISRPAGVEGRTLTLDGAALELTPGKRATDAALSVTLRSSRGAQHSIGLPAGADLQSLSVDGAVLSAKLDQGAVVVPVQPGRHDIRVAWREPRGLWPLFKTSKVDLGGASVDARVQVNLPSDRWPLCMGGPRLGPAVLFWSLLAVFLLVSAGLGRLGLTPLGWRQWFLLSVGLSQVPVPAAALVAGWLVLLGWRGKNPREDKREFDVLQCFLAALTLLALLCLFSSIKKGLLGLPDMQVSGNDSSAYVLRWYKDRSGAHLPRAWVFSLPIAVYRLAMLGWALWLANALLGWLKWGWDCFGAGGLWKPLRPPAADVPPPPAP